MTSKQTYEQIREQTWKAWQAYKQAWKAYDRAWQAQQTYEQAHKLTHKPA